MLADPAATPAQPKPRPRAPATAGDDRLHLLSLGMCCRSCQPAVGTAGSNALSSGCRVAGSHTGQQLCVTGECHNMHAPRLRGDPLWVTALTGVAWSMVGSLAVRRDAEVTQRGHAAQEFLARMA